MAFSPVDTDDLLSADLISSCQDIFTEFGEVATFTRTNNGTYDPSTGGVDMSTNIPYTGMIVPKNYKDYEVDGTIVQHGDIRVMLSVISGGYIPSPDDEVSFGSFTGKIINVERQRFQGADIYYYVQLRA